MSTASDQWAWYKAAMAGDAPALSDDGTVRSGFFWSKASRGGGRIPVAIWTDVNGEIKCRYGTRDKHQYLVEGKMLERWPWIQSNPVSRDNYKVAYETGTWPDGTPTVAPDVAKAGSNLPTDPFERLQAEIADKIASAEKWMKDHPEAKSQTEADYATNLHREINALIKQADTMFTTEKAPHLAAAKAVDEKFRFRDGMKAVGVRLKSIFERFMVKKEAEERRKQQEKYEAERRATELARQEAEKAYQKRLADDPIAALTSPEPELPELPVAPAPVKVQSGGGIGRAAGLKSVWVGQIEDVDAVFQHFKEVPAVIDALQKLVDATVRTHKGAAKIPGVKVSEERRAA